MACRGTKSEKCSLPVDLWQTLNVQICKIVSCKFISLVRQEHVPSQRARQCPKRTSLELHYISNALGFSITYFNHELLQSTTLDRKSTSHTFLEAAEISKAAGYHYLGPLTLNCDPDSKAQTIRHEVHYKECSA